MPEGLSSSDLEAIGFRDVGEWTLDDDRLSYELTQATDPQAAIDRRNALYAFVQGRHVFYIGKTARTVLQRLYNYRQPGPSQSTNIRCNGYIRDELSAGRPVAIMAFTPTSHLRYGDYEINLAAGLEDTLIEAFEPMWNGRRSGRLVSEQAEREITEACEAGPALAGAGENGKRCFKIRLGSAYRGNGFINFGVDDSPHLAGHGDALEIFIGDEADPVDTMIDRRANTNGTVRTRPKNRLRMWFQTNFAQGDEVHGTIIDERTVHLANSAATR